MAKKAEKKVAVSTATGRAKIGAAYKEVLQYQFIGTGILAGVVTLMVLISYTTAWFGLPLLLLVMLAGMLGAFFSALTRLYHLDAAAMMIFATEVQRFSGKGHLWIYSFVPPVVGAIAAVMLYLVFMAGYIHTDLFPTIACLPGKSCQSIQDLMNYYWPKEPQDYGKALVWAFIAGFSERLVPDILQSLAAKQSSAGKK